MAVARPPGIDRLCEQLVDQAHRHGLEADLILPPAAAAMLLLGTQHHQQILTGLAALDDPLTTLQALFTEQTTCLPYLDGHLEVLTSILTRSDRPLATRAVRGMLTALAEADLLQLADSATIAGDLLGPLYSMITSKAARSARGAFYTPPSLGAVLAALVDVNPGESFSDPCCGSGGLAIATIRAMRATGRVPELVHWHLQDIDPVAVALAGVQLASHGMPWVTLKAGDALQSHPTPIRLPPVTNAAAPHLRVGEGMRERRSR